MIEVIYNICYNNRAVKRLTHQSAGTKWFAMIYGRIIIGGHENGKRSSIN